MVDNRSQADRILGARLMGSAKRLGRRELPAEEYAAAVAELRELAAGRADLLAETAGLLEGFGEGEPTGPMTRLAVQLCRRGRGRPGGDTGVDRGGAAPEGRGAAAAVLGRRARRGSTASLTS